MLLSLFLTGFCHVPSHSVFVKLNDNLRTIYISFFRGHQVNHIRSFPALTKSSLFKTAAWFVLKLFSRIFTHHCIKYINTPLSSAAPIILSASRPLLNPCTLLLLSSTIFFLLFILSTFLLAHCFHTNPFNFVRECDMEVLWWLLLQPRRD